MEMEWIEVFMVSYLLTLLLMAAGLFIAYRVEKE